MIVGSVIVIFGVLLLLQNLGFITYDIWGLFLPLVIVVIGLEIATKRGKHHGWCCKQGEGKEEKTQ